MNWIRTLVHRPALVTVIYLIIFIFGLFSYSRLPIDMLPDIQAPVISIVTPYPGASALDSVGEGEQQTWKTSRLSRKKEHAC